MAVPQIAYVAADGGIWLVKADGSGNQQIVPRPAGGPVRDAIWSPDGKRIAYMAITGQTPIPYSEGELWVWDDATRERRKIDDNVSSPRWVLGGRYISYLKDTPNPESDHPTSDWWVVDVTRGDAKSQLPGDAYGYAWSPDGSWLAYNGTARQECDGECYHRATLFVVSLDGSQRQKLTDDGTLFPGPGWSPDGRFLAYWKNEHSGSAVVGDIYVMDLTTGAEIRLGEFTSDEFPQWAPGKNQDVFHNLRIDPQTGETEELFERPGAIVAWSPDARKVAYVEGRPFGRGPRSLVVLDLSSGQRGTFHTSQADIAHVLSPGYYGEWSPDGRYLTFVGFEGDETQASLYVADTTTGAVRPVLERFSYAEVFVSYSPAGDHLLVQQHEVLPPSSAMPSPTPIGVPMGHTIWVADPDGSHPVKIADGTAISGPPGLPGWRPQPSLEDPEPQ
jgi:Tol biopolymer transport system component